jgi:hypothetical protein
MNFPCKFPAKIGFSEENFPQEFPAEKGIKYMLTFQQDSVKIIKKGGDRNESKTKSVSRKGY